MKAPDFAYVCPKDLEEALLLISDDTRDSQPLAGGQSLMPMMHLRMASPEVLIDLNKLSELDFITKEDSTICVGAMVRYSTLLESPIIREHIPLFTRALPYIAHEAIRNRGTIGGSIALADPAAEMPALLLALDANIIVISKSGKRTISANDFFIGIYDTALAEDELVHSINIPVCSAEQRFGFYELARRHGDYAMAGVAISSASVSPYTDLRIVFFSIADRALRAIDAENYLNGTMPDDTDTLAQAQSSLSTLDFYADANASVDMKSHLAGVVLKRGLQSMVTV